MKYYFKNRNALRSRSFNSQTRFVAVATALIVAVCLPMIILWANPIYIPAVYTNPRALEVPTLEERKNCQMIYVLGVEGSGHHGINPVLEALSRRQKTPETGLKYRVKVNQAPFRKALFGNQYEQRSIDDPSLVKDVILKHCPDDGYRDVIIQGASFPSGFPEKTSFRVTRQSEWKDMSMEEIANSETALNHPFNLHAMLQAYSPYAEIRFIVLHRDFFSTIASHPYWDDGPIGHSNVLRGFMLLISRFLNENRFDPLTGDPLWKLVCIDTLYSNSYKNSTRAQMNHRSLTMQLANFLSWETGECPHCFDTWRDSTRDWHQFIDSDTEKILELHEKELDGIWPPFVEEDASGEQCRVEIPRQ